MITFCSLIWVFCFFFQVKIGHLRPHHFQLNPATELWRAAYLVLCWFQYWHSAVAEHICSCFCDVGNIEHLISLLVIHDIVTCHENGIPDSFNLSRSNSNLVRDKDLEKRRRRKYPSWANFFLWCLLELWTVVNKVWSCWRLWLALKKQGKVSNKKPPSYWALSRQLWG